jgi:replicative DNA helicase
MIDHSRLHSTEAEQSVLGALLQDVSAADRVGALKPEHFYKEENRTIYRRLMQMIGRGEPVDVVTVAEALDTAGETELTGGLAYLGDLVMNTPSTRNAGRYAETVIGKAMERQLLGVSEEIREVVAGVGSSREKLMAAQAAVMSVTESVASKEPRQMRDVLLSAIQTMERRSAGELPGLKTGIDQLDAMLTGGLKPGNLIIIAGRPGMGKTSLALQFAVEASQANTPALVLSMEMCEGELADRMIANVGHVPLDSVLSGTTDDEIGDRIHGAIVRLRDVPLAIDDQSGLTLFDVAAKARSVRRKHGLGLLVIDYLQLMTGDGDNRNQQIEQISRGLKSLAKELAIPIIALSQLSRNCENRSNRRPIPSDLRESGAIEQDADVIAFVYRDEIYNPSSPDRGTAEIIVGKNRQGKTGTVRTAYIGEQTRFANLAHDWAPAAKDVPFAKARRGFSD